MNTHNWQRLEDLFAAALALPRLQREEFLEPLAHEDPNLFAELKSLLAVHDQTTSFVDVPMVLPESVHDLPRTIGPYTIEGKIGEGGSSHVFLARQGQHGEPVAIKVLKPGMEHSEILHRFERERKILSALIHPNIARLIDGGSMENGRPYFVMQRIVGDNLRDFCSRKKLTIEASLVLFRKVCEAVHFAHQNLIVHRDLKPSNIMVTADANPVILDFGLAKIVFASQDEETSTTATECRMLTPQYASPEQFLGGPTTTAMDIYALGVVLYEILTGFRPCDVNGAASLVNDRALFYDRIEPPSLALRRVMFDHAGSRARDQVHERCAALDISPERLARKLAGDLDNIVMLAIAKDPLSRYQSALELADDLEKHALGVSIRARKLTFSYYATRFLKRHRMGVAISGVFLALILTSLGIAARQAYEAERERERAEVERTTSATTLDLLVQIFKLSDPNNLKRGNVTINELLKFGSQQAQLSAELPAEVRAKLLGVIGAIYLSTGQFSAAKSMLEQATSLLSVDCENVEDVTHAELCLETAEVEYALNEFDRAERLHRRLCKTFEAADPLLKARNLLSLAMTIHDRRPYYDREPLDLAIRALALRREQLGGYHPLVADALDFLGSIHHAQGTFKLADQFYSEARDIRHQSLPSGHAATIASTMNLAVLYTDLGQYSKALPLLEEALFHSKANYGNESPNAATILYNMGQIQLYLGNYALAEDLHRRALEVRVSVFGPENLETTGSYHALALSVQNQGRLAEAEALHRKGLQARIQALGSEGLNVADSLYKLATLLRLQGDFDDAKVMLEESLRQHDQAVTRTNQLTTRVQVALGSLLTAHGRAHEAESILREALAVNEVLFPSEHWRIGENMLELAHSLHLMDKPEARVWLEHSYGILAPALGSEHPLVKHAQWLNQNLLAQAI